MPCAVVVPNSPIFSSPLRIPPMFCKSSSSSPCSSPRSPLPVSSSSSPKSALSLRAQRQGAGSGIASGLGWGSTSVKRKRPARLDIPVQTWSIAVETPRGEERVEVVEVDGDGYSVYCKRGRRGPMEDRFCAVVDGEGDDKQAFFGVFDGHGGSKAAEFAAKNLDKNIKAELLNSRCEEGIESAIKKGYLTTDIEFLKEDVSGGTCSVTALIQEGDLVVSNVGDCRAVMSRGGVAEALTSDHQASRKDERDRIEALGGYVDCRNGVWRIQGTLAVSRGIGDGHLKTWVIAEPETKILRIKSECEFVILASDGLWDKVTNQEAVNLVRPFCTSADKPEPHMACKKLVELSSRRGSTDDISVMIIQLSCFVS